MIYVDMDGVLADFEQGIIDHYGREFSNEIADGFWKKTCVSDCIFMRLPVIQQGLNMLRTIKGAGLSPCILTSTGGGRHHLNIARQKLIWLEDHGVSDVPVAFCMNTQGKGAYAQPDAYLIDDREKVCRTWEDWGGSAIRFRPELAGKIAISLTREGR